MNLDRVKIVNFRSIKDLTLRLDPPCRVLVGINEAGKTNILKALSLLSPNNKPAPDDIREISLDEKPITESSILFFFSLDSDERQGIYEYINDDVLCSNPKLHIIQYDSKKLSLSQVCNQVSEFIYNVNVLKQQKYGSYWQFPKNHKLIGGWLKPGPNCPDNFMISYYGGKERPLKSFFIVHEDDCAEIPSSYLVPATIEMVHKHIGTTLIKLLEENLPECIFWHYSDRHLIPGRIGLNSFAQNPDSCLPLKNAFILAGYTNILETINVASNRPNGIRNILDRVARVSTNHIRTIWPEYKDLSIDLRQNGDSLDTGIKDIHNLYDFARRSDGFKRFISFLMMISAPTKTANLANILILCDDVETALHPSGARYLRDELIKVSESNYVVYSTHSIFMIDRDKINRHVLVSKHNEVTIINDANESNILDEEVLYNALGYSVFDTLKQKNVVFEGWRDKTLLRIALSRVPKQFSDLKNRIKDLGLCHVQGVKDVRRITPLLELANRSCFIISDGDKAAREHQAHHRKDKLYGHWIRYDELLQNFGPVTAEDFLQPSAIEKGVSSLVKQDAKLSTLTVFKPSGNPGVLKEIDQWLSKGGVSQEDRKPLLDKLKDIIFSSLRPANIRNEYYEFVKALIDKIDTTI